MTQDRELDARVAGKVMGWDVVKYNDTLEDFIGRPLISDQDVPRVPQYSTDIAAAWKVVEKVVSDAGHDWKFNCVLDGTGWAAYFSRSATGGGAIIHKNEADSAPHAICLAALKAVGA